MRGGYFYVGAVAFNVAGFVRVRQRNQIRS